MKAIKDGGISLEIISRFRNAFIKNDKDCLAQTVAARSNLLELALNRNSVIDNPHVYNVRLATEGKPVTNQRNSGRCWIFACLNVMRLHIMKQLRLDEFELSQNHLFFWDKIERSYFNINAYLECARAGETRDGRLVQHLLREPAMDGGQWDMMVNLIEKYGVMPKSCWTESWSCENSHILNAVLETKLREYCHDIFALVEAGISDDEIRTKHMERMMGEVYRVVSICLGTPPNEFTFEYYANNSNDNEGDKPKSVKGKVSQKIGPIAPLDFYKKYVKPTYDVEKQICIVNDPRPDNPYNAVYSVEKLNNMHNGRQVRYLNLPVDKLKELTLQTLRQNNAVWFGCHVSRHFNVSKGLNVIDVYDYELLLGVRPFAMSKADRLIYGDSLMTHAMTITAAHVDGLEETCETKNGEKEEESETPATVGAHGKFQRWRVENSWGSDSGSAGYICMNDEWFNEYVYEIAVDRSLLDDELLSVYEGPVKMLPAWDPMGALAK